MTRIASWSLPCLTALLMLLAGQLPAQNLPLVTLGNLPAVLSESSGLLAPTSNLLWSHNDSGGEPKLYAFDSTGTLVRTLVIAGASQVDWEEITRDSAGYVYIGDFGNNANNRTNLRIYRVPDPAGFAGDTVQAEVIAFSYADQTAFPPADSGLHYDMEAMVAWGDSLYLFSKNRTNPFDGYTRMYRLPQAPGTYQAELVDSLYLGAGNVNTTSVTGAALSPNGQQLLLTGYPRCWLLSCFTPPHFLKGSLVELGYSLSQREAVAWRDDHTVYLTDERVQGILGGKLYRGDLRTWSLVPVVDLGPDTVYIGQVYPLSVDSLPGSQILWSTGAQSASIGVQSSGTYWVEVTSAAGCQYRDTVVVDIQTGLEARKAEGLQIWPIPSRGQVKLACQGLAPCRLRLYDLQGRLYHDSTLAAGGRMELQLPAGQAMWMLRWEQAGRHSAQLLPVR